MDDGIRELAQMAVDFARKVELTNEEEAELLKLVAAAYRDGVASCGLEDILVRLVDLRLALLRRQN